MCAVDGSVPRGGIDHIHDYIGKERAMTKPALPSEAQFAEICQRHGVSTLRYLVQRLLIASAQLAAIMIFWLTLLAPGNVGSVIISD